MSLEDFFKNFESITICKVSNWKEVRLKGKFLRAHDVDADEDWVLSKFYYSFKLDKKTKMDICLHQDDERVLGAKRRPYVDLQILVIKRNDNGTLTLVHDSGTRCDRDIDTCVNLDPGHYVVVPRSCGGTLRGPTVAKKLGNMFYNFRGSQRLDPDYRAAIDEIFRKLDLEMNRALCKY